MMINLLNGDSQPSLDENVDNGQPVQPEQVQETPDNTADDGSQTTEEKLLAGRFKTVEELEKGYGELNSQQGQQGNELGALQTQIAEQNRQMAELIASQNNQQQQAQQEPQQVDFETERAKIGAKMDEGELSIPDGLAQLRKIDAVETDQRVQGMLAQVQDGFTQQLAERDQETVANRFHEKNPEFGKLQQSGVLQQIIAEDEFIQDDFQAYLKYQANQAYVKGKDEAANEIAGSAPAGDVVSNAGSQIRNEAPAAPGRKLNDAEMLDSGLAALKATGFQQT